jgi:hypothetical protein
MTSFYPSVRFQRQCPRTRDRDVAPQAVFTDQASLPAASNIFWANHLIPILVSPCSGHLVLPTDWSMLRREFSHHFVGGSTDATHSVALLLPREYVHDRDAWPILLRRPASTILSSLNCHATACPLRSTPSVLTEMGSTVVLLADGSVGAWGLLPANSPSRMLTVPYERSSSG